LPKHIFVSFKRNILDNLVRLRYLKTEEVETINKLSNERARESLKHFKIFDQCEITSIGDLPASTGLGSSGSYLVSLITAIQQYKKLNMSKHDIAELACKIEMEELNEPVGKQDQFIASYGGIKTFNIDTKGNVEVENFDFSSDDLKHFIQNNRIYYTGIQRSASEVLKSQKTNQTNFEDKMKKISDLSLKFVTALKQKNYDYYGQLLNEHWMQKKALSPYMTTNNVEQIYYDLMNNNKIFGGKIIGAGGGGFLLVYCNKDHSYVDNYMQSKGMLRLDYNVDFDGANIVYES
jgi:D-glycero-alpha-D-manno-heptose-7-phosphate kinase